MKVYAVFYIWSSDCTHKQTLDRLFSDKDAAELYALGLELEYLDHPYISICTEQWEVH